MHVNGMCILFFACLLGLGDVQTTPPRRAPGTIRGVAYAIFPGYGECLHLACHLGYVEVILFVCQE